MFFDSVSTIFLHEICYTKQPCKSHRFITNLENTQNPMNNTSQEQLGRVYLLITCTLNSRIIVGHNRLLKPTFILKMRINVVYIKFQPSLSF